MARPRSGLPPSFGCGHVASESNAGNPVLGWLCVDGSGMYSPETQRVSMTGPEVGVGHSSVGSWLWVVLEHEG